MRHSMLCLGVLIWFVLFATEACAQASEAKFVRGSIGVVFKQVHPELGLDKDAGALVIRVAEGGPAERAGIKPGDVIVEFDGKEIKSWTDLPVLVARTAPGRNVPLRILRNENDIIVNVEIGQASVTEFSRDSTVEVLSNWGKLKGTGFLISDRHVVTAFHVAASLSVSTQKGEWISDLSSRRRGGAAGSLLHGPDTGVRASMPMDLHVKMPDGEIVPAICITCFFVEACLTTSEIRLDDELLPNADVCKQVDLAPLKYDFAILVLPIKPKTQHKAVWFLSGDERLNVGDEVIFSGYPLTTPGMLTHRGMISGIHESEDLISVQAAVNKGNSGGAVLNRHGEVIGMITMREGGISPALAKIKKELEAGPRQLVSLPQTLRNESNRGDHALVNLERIINALDQTLATQEFIETVDTYISTGIGYFRPFKFIRDYIASHPKVLQ
jgi:PDZ domain/Trypsin-like peptidase domain